MTRILVVDDREADRDSVVGLLRAARPACEVAQADSGLAALEMIAAAPPDLVLMDMNMPELDGLATLRRIRVNPRLALLPVIFVSAEENRERWVEAFEAGASDFVHKPFETRELLARIDTHLRISSLTRLLDRKNVQLERERRLARTVQAGLLPRDLTLPGLSVSAFYQAQEHIGGDFYDVWQRGGRVHCVMGDISGHGTPSALLMAVCKGLLQSLALEDLPPREAVAELNHMLYAMCSQGDLAMFVTMVYASIDVVEGELHLVCAGHPSPCLLTCRGQTAIAAGGPALGLMPEAAFEECRLPFAPGDCLFLYTDGLIEAPGPHGERFGEKRLIELCARERRPRELVAAIREAATAHCGGYFADDVALLALRRREG